MPGLSIRAYVTDDAATTAHPVTNTAAATANQEPSTGRQDW